MFWGNKFICDLKKKHSKLISSKKAYSRHYEMCKIDDNSNNKHGDFFLMIKLVEKNRVIIRPLLRRLVHQLTQGMSKIENVERFARDTSIPFGQYQTHNEPKTTIVRSKNVHTKPNETPQQQQQQQQLRRQQQQQRLSRSHTARVAHRATKTSRTEFNSYHIINCIPLYVSQEK